jgi:YVTN family beta-propeller protein
MCLPTVTSTDLIRSHAGLPAVSVAAQPVAYVANSASDSVSVIDTASNTVIATIPDASFPQGLAVTPDGSRVYTANSGSSTVAVINAATNTVAGTIAVGAAPVGIAISPGAGPPTTRQQCKKGGWKAFTIPRSFKNQGDCVSFVNTGT